MDLALPNLHPAVVHFPIVLIPLAVLLTAITLVTEGQRVSSRATALAWLAAALAATVAFFAGRSAADGLVGIPPQVQPLIGDHADQAQRTLILTWVIAVIYGAISPMKPQAAAARGGQILALGGGLVAFALVGWTADRGGLLVYQHGLAVTAPPPPAPDCEPAPAAAAASPPGDRLSTDEGGTITWAPAPGDLSAEGLPVSVSGAISEGEPADGVVALAVDGSGTILLPETMESVQVNAWVDLSGFEGEASVLHHVGKSDTEGGFFAVSTAGSARLAELSGKVLDESELDLSGLRAISVSAAGAHYKGLVNGKLITHGHGPELAPGRVGLRLDGRGQVLLRSIEAVPLEAH